MIIRSNDTLNNFGIPFDFTHIYTYLYSTIDDFTKEHQPDIKIDLSQEEKLKLQYRLDIITMLVYIFSAFVIMII
jgi:hypothetical protein